MLRNLDPHLAKPNDPVWRQMNLLLQSLGMELHVPIERSNVQRTLTHVSVDQTGTGSEGLLLWAMRAAQAARIRLAPVQLSLHEAKNLLADGFCLVAINLQERESSWWIFNSIGRSGIGAIEIHESIDATKLSPRQLKDIVTGNGKFGLFIAEPSLMNDATSVSEAVPVDEATHSGTGHSIDHHAHSHGAHPEHLSPLKRFMALLRKEKPDLYSIGVYSFISVVLGLATPLTVEILVNTIGFGRSFQPILVLSLVLLAVLVLSSAFKLLQMIVVEIMQRRFFVRLVGDLAYRLPNANRAALQGVHGPELVNRFFDIMTIQKSTASILLDGTTLVTQTIIGTLLLAFYHPYLLGFDVGLLLCMTLITYLLGRGGIQTAINESIVKYKVAHWLQDVIATPTAFKLHGGAELCADRTNRLTVEYLAARRKHYLVLIRQIIFALLLLPISMTALYALGGYLVISKQLTLGQLVAAELVIGVIVGAFAKSGKLFESFYDLMSAMDKVGHLLDLPVDPPIIAIDSGFGPVSIRVENLHAAETASRQPIDIGSFRAEPGDRLAIIGTVGAADSLVLPAIVGLTPVEHGFIEIGGLDSRDALRFSDGCLVGFAGPREFFAATIIENIRLARSGISDVDIRDALEIVELWEEILPLSEGLDTKMQTGGYPLCEDQLPRLLLARAIAGRPRALLIDWLLDSLPNDIRYRIWERLIDKSQPWTLLITTHDEQIIKTATNSYKIRGRTSH